MNTPHTPGPWHRNIRAKGKYPTVFAGRSTHIATACQMEESSQTEANIDLIAAAPELLSALEYMVEAFNVEEPDSLVAFMTIEKARAVIAKATGQITHPATV